MDYKDYYQALGVAKKATQDEIQKAYRKLARKLHPDVNKSDGAEARFKEINEAYEVLKDPEKRKKYDRFGSAWRQAQTTGGQPPGFEDLFGFGFGGPGGARVDFGGGDSGFSSFFDMLFGGAGRETGGAGQATWSTGGWPGGQPPRGPSRGQDHEAQIRLTLEEAARGGNREIQMTDPQTAKTRTLRVKIPAGVRPGQRIRLANQGGPAPPGGKRGSLYLKIELLPHPRYRLEGSDLMTTLPLSPWEAALGGKVTVDTLEGERTVRIPPGSSSGRKIRLRGLGFPGPGDAKGDLYAELKIVVPDQLSDRERELYNELAEASPFEARRTE
jgi:curved DNA-binding protein